MASTITWCVNETVGSAISTFIGGKLASMVQGSTSTAEVTRANAPGGGTHLLQKPPPHIPEISTDFSSSDGGMKYCARPVHAAGTPSGRTSRDIEEFWIQTAGSALASTVTSCPLPLAGFATGDAATCQRAGDVAMDASAASTTTTVCVRARKRDGGFVVAEDCNFDWSAMGFPK